MQELEMFLERELDVEMAGLIEEDLSGFKFEAFRVAEWPHEREPYEYVDLYVTFTNRVYLDGVQQDVYLPFDVWALREGGE